MSLDKAIQHGKEHRKPYHRAGKFDRTCRPGGSCPYCQSNRFGKRQKILNDVEKSQQTASQIENE